MEKTENIYEEIERLVEVFKHKIPYDAIDEDTFESDYFRLKMENHLSAREEYDSDEEYLADAMITIIYALNSCQYGDISSADADDEIKILEDLTDREFLYRLFI